MRLIYLGHTFLRSPSKPQPCRKPYAVNWRYQVPNEAYGEEFSRRFKSTYSVPKVISWRWQVLTSQ